MKSFPQEVIDKIEWYVYRLIDPRNGETFYVGKGKGNRIFAHICQEASVKLDELDPKLERIRDINISGFEVAHIIHRHGLDENTAMEVEAALIDAYSGLTNIAGGAGSSETGVMHAIEIVAQYAAEEAKLKHKALIITVNRSSLEKSLYDATRYAWKLSLNKAQEAELVLPAVKGLIVGAYVPEKWLPAKKENFPDFALDDRAGRIGFIGREAPLEILKYYKGKRVPDSYRRKGAANPVRYTW